MTPFFYPYLSQITTFFKFIELTSKGINASQTFWANYQTEQQFEQFFNQRHFKFDPKKIQQVFQFDTAEIELAIKLPYILAFRYLHDEEFNAIRMAADYQKQFGILRMEEYFITPSYIPEADLRRRSSIIKLETENSNAKIEQLRTARFQNFLPYEYISGSLFKGIDRVVVTGNPGVGKSTYARWLCYNWAQEKLNIEGILIYINLRLLPFGNHNSIVHYIANTYFAGTDTQSLQKVLTTLGRDMYFVLDGFDELNDQRQKQLKSDLDQLSSQAKFILLSRPYGLLNNQGLAWDFSFQIDGFNHSNIYNYVDRFLQLNQKQDQRDDLLRIIRENRVLEDYAHNPLMLSFITYLYLVEAQPARTLLSIESQYQLQNLVFNWIRKHELVKKSEASLQHRLTEAQQLAYQMEINKQLIIVRNEFNGEEYDTSKYLGFAGLGNMQNTAPDQWQFSFNTLTFQEFLAAKYRVQEYTTTGFLYLCQDRFFWNFSRMLIGAFSTNGQQQLVVDILTAHYQTFDDTRLSTHLYLYLTHLAEAPKSFLQQVIEEAGVQQLYSIYQLGFWQPQWYAILLEAVGRIYSKMNWEQRKQLKDIMLEELRTILQPKSFDQHPNIEHTKHLIIKLRLYHDLEFIEPILELQEYALCSISEESDENHFELVHEGIMFIFEEILYVAEIEHLLIYREQMERLLAAAEDSLFIVPHAKLKLPFITIEPLVEDLSERVTALANQLQQPDSETEAANAAIELAIKKITTLVYQIGGSEHTTDPAFRDQVLPLFLHTCEVIAGRLDLRYLEVYDQTEAGQLLLEGLAKFNAVELYDWILEIGAVLDTIYVQIRIPDNEAYFAYLQQLLRKCQEEKNGVALLKLISAFNFIENTRNQFARIRTPFANVLINYVKANYTAFDTTVGGHTISTDEEEVDDEPSATSWFNNIVYSELLNSESGVFDYDKKYLLDEFTAFHNITYFRQYFQPMTWGKDFNLYQADYWNLIMDYTKKHDYLTNLLTILRNPTIYRYASNLPYLLAIHRYYLSLPTELFEQGGDHDDDRLEKFCLRLLEMLSRGLALLKSSSEELPEQAELLQSTIALCKKYNLRRRFLESNVPVFIEGKDLLLFILLYYFTQSETYDLGIDYDDWLDNHKNERHDLIATLIQLFTVEEKLQTTKLQIVYPILGKNLVQRIDEFLVFKPELVNDFSVGRFEQENNWTI